MTKKLFILMLIIAIFFSTSVSISANQKKINLTGYFIYVDAGHGGKDNGANYNNVLEDTINLNINNYLVETLVDSGAIVYTTRDGDYDLADNYDKNRKAKDLKKRVNLINELKPNLFVSIHLNTYANESVKGGQVFHQNNKESEKLANVLQTKFNEMSGKDKKAKLGDYYLLNKTNVVGVIIECGFLTNSEDLKNLTNDKYQKKIAKLISESIFEYFYKSS